MTTPLVSVIMPTYNHEKYIAQAIESVLVQECDFKYQIIIGEDCSTDNTRAICETYAAQHPDKIILLSSTANLGLVLNYKQLFDASTTKYCAILEGDDYWTDTQKLQIQVDIMEQDDRIGLVHTRSCSLYENGDLKVNMHLRQSQKVGKDFFEEILTSKYGITPLTVCFRKAVFDKYVNYNFCIANNLKTIDFFLWNEMAMHTQFYFIDVITGHYRILSNSISNTKDFEKFKEWYKKSIVTLDYFKSNYPLSEKTKKLLYSSISSNAVEIGFTNKEYNFAKQNAKNVVVTDFKSFLNHFLGSCSALHFMYPLHSKMILLLSKLKQKLLK